MTDTVKRTYIGIHDAVTVPALNGRIVERGETIDVHKSIAGRPAKGKPGDEDYDPGDGLDAQPENWATPGQAKQAAKKATAHKRAAKKTTAASKPPVEPTEPVVPSEPPATPDVTTPETTEGN